MPPRRTRTPRSSCRTRSGGGSGSGERRRGRRPRGSSSSDVVAFGVELQLVVGLVVFVGRLVGVAVAVSVSVLRLLDGRDQLGEHPGERVHLMTAQLGAGGEAGRALGEHALEPEHQRVANLPLARRRRVAPPRSRRVRRRGRDGGPCPGRGRPRGPRPGGRTARLPRLLRGGHRPAWPTLPPTRSEIA